MPHRPAESFTQVRLVDKSTAQRDVAQRQVGLQHVLNRALQPAPDHEGVRGFSERPLEGAREMRFAQLEECGEIRDR